jgi:ATP-binding protein involved in chromosome partitioning
LGQIPLVQSIREGSDDGKPAILSQNIIAEEFEKLTENLIQRIEERNSKLAPTKIVEITNTTGCGTH